MFYRKFLRIYLLNAKTMATNDALKKLPDNFDTSDFFIKSYIYNDSKHLEMNLYSSKSFTKSTPCIIDLHGGAWIYGDKDLNTTFAYKALSANFKVISITYPLLDNKISLVDVINEIYNCFLYIAHHHKELDLDLNNMFLTGDSAGAQLGLFLTNLLTNDKLFKEFDYELLPFNFNALALNHAVCYLDDAANLKGHKWISKNIAIPGLLRFMFGKNYQKNKYYHLIKNPEDSLTKPFIPTLIISSYEDDFFSYQSVRLYQYLKKNNYNVDFYFELDKNAEHVFNVSDPFSETSQKCNNYLFDFFLKYKK